MKRRIKSAAALFSAMVIAGTLSGCSVGFGSSKADEVSISVAWGTSSSARANAPKTIEAFKKEYGNIEVKPDAWIQDTPTYYMKASTGRLPTIFSSAMTEAERFKRFGFNIDMSEQIEKYGYDRYTRKEIKDIISENGNYYAIPKSGYLLGVVFNAELFEEAGLKNNDGTYKIPKTYIELAETAKIIKEKTGKPGLLIETDKRVGGWLFSNIAWAYGTEFIKYENGKWIAAFDSPECVEAFQYMWDLKWKYEVIPENPHCDQHQAQRRIVEGNCAMIIDGGIDSIYNTWGGDKETLGMFSMPEGPNGKYALLGGEIYGISNTASEEEVEAAFKWIEFIGATPEGKKEKSVKENIEKKYETLAENDKVIGLKAYSIWTDDCPIRIAENEMREKYRNVPEELFADYNDMIDGKISVIIKPEEKVACQDLYYILTDCLKEIYENKDVDLERLVADAAKKFQTEYLDKIN